MSFEKSNVMYSSFFSPAFSFSVNTSVGVVWSNSLRLEGSERVRSMTNLNGLAPYQLRVVSEGLSSSAYEYSLVFCPLLVNVH